MFETVIVESCLITVSLPYHIWRPLLLDFVAGQNIALTFPCAFKPSREVLDLLNIQFLV